MRNIIGFILAVLIVFGCNTSKITSTWKAAYMPQKEYHHILVLGIINDKDRSIREKMENHFIGDLNELGYTAFSSLKEYGPKAFGKTDENAAIHTLSNSGMDAVITIVLLDKKKERKYVPSHALYPVAGNYSNRFWEYQTALNQRIFEPGYYVTDTRYFWETNFYDVATQKLVYSAQTKSFDPANAESMGHEYGRMVVKDMVKQNVLKDLTGKF